MIAYIYSDILKFRVNSQSFRATVGIVTVESAVFNSRMGIIVYVVRILMMSFTFGVDFFFSIIGIKFIYCRKRFVTN